MKKTHRQFLGQDEDSHYIRREGSRSLGREGDIDGVPIEAIEDIAYVRNLGVCNMFDIKCVRQVAKAAGLYSLLPYTASPSEYSRLLKAFEKALDSGVVE